MPVYSINQAVERYCRSVNKQPARVIPRNRRYHRDILFRDGSRVRLIYKRELFHSFAEKFPELGYDCEGESIHVGALNTAEDDGCEQIVSVLKDGRIHALDVSEWKAFALIENWTVRDTEQQSPSEKTCSVPVQIMEVISNGE